MFKYISYAILGGFFSMWGYVGSAIVGHEAGQTEALLLSISYIGVICFLVFNKEPEKFAYVLVLPMFIVIGMHIIYSTVTYSIWRWTPDSDAFTAECSKAEVKYIKPPTMPVRSIAYDWDSEVAPSFIEFKAMGETKVSELRLSAQPKVKDLRFDFVEINRTSDTKQQCQSYEDFRYIRYPNNATCYNVSKLEANVIVMYKTRPIEQKKDAAIRYEITVSDRRNGDKLAYLRYVVDIKKQRACGLTGKGRVNDDQFIQKAIGF